MLVSESSAMHQLRRRSAQKPQLDLIADRMPLEHCAAHELGKTRDWVVLSCEEGTEERRYTVITSQFGHLSGRHIVAGHQIECEAYYKRHKVSEPCEKPERRCSGLRT